MKNFTFLLCFSFPLFFYGQKTEGLSFETTTYDFGNITSKSKAEARFLFSNTSDSPVQILKIHGENHCIEIDSLSKKTYAPKEKGMISVTYDTSCKGHIRKTLSVFTTGQNNTISLKLIGKVED